MLSDAIEHRDCYRGISPRLDAALDFLAEQDPADFHEHAVEIDGRDIFAMFQEYETGPATGKEYEAHRQYIDIQYVVMGEETIRVANIAALQSSKAYDAGSDAEMFGLLKGTELHLRAGDFAILFPQDAHLPRLPENAPTRVRKIVVKVRLETGDRPQPGHDS